MSQSNPICRLCANPCQEFKSLYDEKGLENWLYKWTYKMFHPGIVNMEEYKTLTIICEKCCIHILDCSLFESTIKEGQLKLQEELIKLQKQLEEQDEDQDDQIIMDIEIKEEYIPLEPDEMNENIVTMKSIDGGDTSTNEHEQQKESDNDERQGVEENTPAASDRYEVTFLKSENLEEKQSTPNETKISNKPIPDTWIPIIKCAVCSQNYCGYSEHRDHFRLEHPEEQFHIICCNQTIRLKWQFEQHAQVHNNPKAFECKQCDLCFSTPRRQLAHMERYHPGSEDNKEFKCEICGKGYLRLSGLNQHYKHRHGRTGNSDPQGPSTSKGLAVGSKAKQFVCSVCKKCFDNKKHLYVHFEEVHKNEEMADGDTLRKEKKFVCDKCDKSFCNVRALIRHSVRDHGGGLGDDSKAGPKVVEVPAEKSKFVCDICQKGFYNEEGLNVHLAVIHNITNEDLQAQEDGSKHKFVCDICNKCFMKQQGLNLHHAVAHRKNHHVTVKPKNICEICNESFKDQRTLNTHRTKSHNKREVPLTVHCDVCRKGFYDQIGLRIHKTVMHATNDKGNNSNTQNKKSLQEDSLHDLTSSSLADDSQSAREDPETMDVILSHSEYSSDEETQLSKDPNCPKDKLGRKLSIGYQEKTANIDKLVAKFMPNIKCDLCPESLAKLSLLRQHFREEHPNDLFYFSCCYMKLNALHLIVNHVRIHLDPETFKCVHCNRNYSTKKYLTSHIYDQHPDTITQKFICSRCKISFVTMSKLKLHFKEKHQNSIRCKNIKHFNNRRGFAKDGIVMAPCPRCPRRFIYIGRQSK